MIKQLDSVSFAYLLNPENVFFLKDEFSRESAVAFLTEKIYPQLGTLITGKMLSQKVAEVERLNQVLETGFYIPHAKFTEIDRFYMALGLLPAGFQDKSSGLTVKAVMLLLSPNKPAFFQKHLNMLSKLSRIFQPAFIETLLATGSPEAVCDLLKSAA
ncbi:MAG: PTS sugar transporter subunit IIA [Elusimicrobia bacterium]|nr:PTS sugar transporter subunit IIA [Elusimicrobiota bacterium]